MLISYLNVNIYYEYSKAGKWDISMSASTLVFVLEILCLGAMLSRREENKEQIESTTVADSNSKDD